MAIPSRFRPGRLPRVAGMHSLVLSSSFAMSMAMRLISTIVLSRLLAPEAFGAVGIMMSLAYVVQMISDVGFAEFVIRHKDGDDPRFQDVIWTIRLIRGFVLTAVLYLLAGPISMLLGKPELKTLCEVFSLYFVLEGAASLSLSLALRNKQVARYNLVDLTSNAVQVVASIGFALLFRNYWAIVASIGVGLIVKAVLSYALFAGSVRRIRFDRAYTIDQLRFARYVTGSSILTLLLSQSDKLVLSRLFELDTLGLYVMAANLAVIPVNFAMNYCNQLLYPRFAQVWRDAPEAMPGTYYSAQWPLSFLYMIGAGGLIGAAPLVIELLYDDRYRGAALFLGMLGLATMLSLPNYAATNVAMAMGRISIKLRVNLIRVGWLGLMGPLGWWYAGPLGLITAYATIEVPALLYQWAMLRSLGLFSARRELGFILLGALGIAAGYAATWVVLPLVRP